MIGCVRRGTHYCCFSHSCGLISSGAEATCFSLKFCSGSDNRHGAFEQWFQFGNGRRNCPISNEHWTWCLVLTELLAFEWTKSSTCNHSVVEAESAAIMIVLNSDIDAFNHVIIRHAFSFFIFDSEKLFTIIILFIRAHTQHYFHIIGSHSHLLSAQNECRCKIWKNILQPSKADK